MHTKKMSVSPACQILCIREANRDMVTISRKQICVGSEGRNDEVRV